jgi:metal-responsive CopG/Arc/MetJ family transcriptional regulator
MQTKKKITITIDEGLFEEVEKASKRFNLSRSHLTQESLSLWLKKKTESLMAKGYLEMAEEDQEFSKLTLDAQWEIKNEQLPKTR